MAAASDRPFDGFILLAAMRTGSNLLEQHLNAVPGVTCHGEAFNPAFPGYPNRSALLDTGLAERDADPGLLLARLRAAPGLNGFRFFAGHDPRALALALADRRCAKIVLQRNPLDAFVSRKIAAETGQWLLRGDVRRRRTARITFDAAEFEAHLAAAEAFQREILSGLQTSGQTAFYLDYEDLGEVAVINGLLAFLGLPDRLDRLEAAILKQNPEPLEDKLANPAALDAELARIDRFDSARLPNFEPRRGAAVPGFIASDRGLLFMPVRGVAAGQVESWLASLGPVETGFTRKTLRQWQRGHPGHRAFTLLGHPLPRAWAAFRDAILSGRRADVRDHLVRAHGLVLPEPGQAADPALLRAAFHVFLDWLPRNLAGQTPFRPDGTWASQTAVLAGFADFGLPDLIARDDTLDRDLGLLAALRGCPPPPPQPVAADPVLAGIADAGTARRLRIAYRRDFVAFGFADRVVASDGDQGPAAAI